MNPNALQDAKRCRPSILRSACCTSASQAFLQLRYTFDGVTTCARPIYSITCVISLSPMYLLYVWQSTTWPRRKTCTRHRCLRRGNNFSRCRPIFLLLFQDVLCFMASFVCHISYLFFSFSRRKQANCSTVPVRKSRAW